MEKYLNKKTKRSLDDLINYIKNSEEYIECMRLKKEIEKDTILINLIQDIKNSQKDYVRSGYDKIKKEELDRKMTLLNQNTLFCTYSYNLDKVNFMINLIKNELSEYFYEITNILK